MKSLGQRNPLAFLSLLLGIAISIALSWFAVSQYRMSLALAEENLRGLALSLSAAIEALAAKDPTFASLRDFQTTDVAYIALIDRNGVILFHANSALTGERLSDRRTALVFEKGEFAGRRVLLGTGETVYESNAPLHAGGKTLALRLALHTYRADRIVGRAQLGLSVIGLLISVAWVMALFLYRYARREKIHAMEMAQRRELARLGEMGAVIAHEIRNPLAGIKGYAQLLQEKQGAEGDAPCAELIVGEAIRLEEIVNGLLAYTQRESTAPAPVRIHDVLTRSLAVIFPEADLAGVRLECLLDRSFVIAGNRDRLEQMFLNLFRNALQAMPDGGKITITGQRVKNSIEVLVADTGNGIGNENLERIFEPFFTTKTRGSGLGLAVCRKIAEEHKGGIVAESAPGKGTAFRITFPVV